jgi:hypothetical protein
MVKTLKDGIICLATQPVHWQVAGYLAAHWDNDKFMRLSY